MLPSLGTPPCMSESCTNLARPKILHRCSSGIIAYLLPHTVQTPHFSENVLGHTGPFVLLCSWFDCHYSKRYAHSAGPGSPKHFV